MNGLVLDASALLAYAWGESIEPGAMIALAGEDSGQQVWIPALSLGEAARRLVGTKQRPGTNGHPRSRGNWPPA